MKYYSFDDVRFTAPCLFRIRAVLHLKAAVPSITAGSALPADATAIPEVSLTLQLADAFPHPNITSALHAFMGSSRMVRPWIDTDLQKAIPENIPYLVLPYYPITLRMLTSTRLATHRTPLTEPEVLMILIQCLSGLMHLLNHGYVHRNISV